MADFLRLTNENKAAIERLIKKSKYAKFNSVGNELIAEAIMIRKNKTSK